MSKMFEEKTKVVSEIKAEYDYIVVGAGAAGCVVASRLSEDSDVTVLLVEVGGDDAGIEATIVAARGGFERRLEHDWKYLPVPQKKACKGSKDNRPIWSCGRCLGGGGTINYMMWMRGVPGDFDLWEKMGCTGWSYKEVLPYFLKSEDMDAPEDMLNNGFHAKGGLMGITHVSWLTALGPAFVDACVDLGYRKVDCNTSDPFGVMTLQANIKNGIRQSTSRTHLRPAMHRPNLDIAIDTLVAKVMMQDKTAVGIQAIRAGKQIEIRARKEVIICAGAIQSPKILMLSGIGPKDHLESLGIPVVADLPAGNNLTDHVALLWPSYTIDQPISINPANLYSDESKELFEKYATGPMASASSLEATILIEPPKPDPAFLGFQVADYQLTIFSAPQIFTKPGNEVFNIEDKMFSTMYDLPEGTHGFSIYTFLSHPKSRGTIRLRSTDPNDHPIIDPNYLDNPDDVESFVRAAKVSMAMCKTKPFTDLGARLITKGVLPGFKPGDEEKDEYIREMVCTLNNTNYHYVGTCRMGAADDPSAVCDPELRVRGIKNLRVIDSGVMPEQTSGNLNCPTIMMAEKGADLIKGKKLPPADLEKANEKLKAWMKTI